MRLHPHTYICSGVDVDVDPHRIATSFVVFVFVFRGRVSFFFFFFFSFLFFSFFFLTIPFFFVVLASLFFASSLVFASLFFASSLVFALLFVASSAVFVLFVDSRVSASGGGGCGWPFVHTGPVKDVQTQTVRATHARTTHQYEPGDHEPQVEKTVPLFVVHDVVFVVVQVYRVDRVVVGGNARHRANASVASWIVAALVRVVLDARLHLVRQFGLVHGLCAQTPSLVRRSAQVVDVHHMHGAVVAVASAEQNPADDRQNDDPHDRIALLIRVIDRRCAVSLHGVSFSSLRKLFCGRPDPTLTTLRQKKRRNERKKDMNLLLRLRHTNHWQVCPKARESFL